MLSNAEGGVRMFNDEMMKNPAKTKAKSRTN